MTDKQFADWVASYEQDGYFPDPQYHTWYKSFSLEGYETEEEYLLRREEEYYNIEMNCYEC